jgi:hypothetical protein
LKNKALNTLLFLVLFVVAARAQNNTTSPYSRYGIGEMAQNTFAHNAGMAGAHIALRPDSTMPIFINAGNPAAYSLIRLTTLEVGGKYQYSDYNLKGKSALKSRGANFAYGALGFPIARNGGACFGIMPYSSVGYDTQSITNEKGIGDVTYRFGGTGDLNKAFIGYGVMPFSSRLIKFRKKRCFIADSLKRLSNFQYKSREAGSKLLSDLSLGFNVDYIFGNIRNITRVTYPNSLLYNNLYRERSLNMGAFTGNFGIQTAITFDSIRDPKKARQIVENEMTALKALNIYNEQELRIKRDSLTQAYAGYKRQFKEKVKMTFGFFGNVQNPLNVNYGVASYDYVLNGSGQEIIRDTALFLVNQKSTITLPLEQGFGIGLKKGERINVVADFAITNWRTFRYLGAKTDLVPNYRTAIGLNWVPEKYAAGQGAFWRKANYRIGAGYQTGFIKIANTTVADYFVSLGMGLPVGIGRLSSMVNISAQVGQVASTDPSLIRQNYLRINFGFTFCDKWFQKFRYD